MSEEKIIRLPKDYRKQASRDLCVFTSSVFGEIYVSTLNKLFGVNFGNMFWVIRDGDHMTFYRSEKDHQHLRQVLGERLFDDRFTMHIAQELREHTDWFNIFIKENDKESFLKRKKEFVEKYKTFFAHHQAVYWGGDYVLEARPELKEIIRILADAYAYNEHVVPNIEKYLKEIDEKDIAYWEDKGEFFERGFLFRQGKDTINLKGKALDIIEEAIKGLAEYDEEKDELKGITVSKGFVMGEVQVITDPNKLDEAQEDKIVVTGMTRPQFNHILGKCAGIITNEGNILSHAAILARESGVPCIVGTQIATEVLKDGNIVELNADTGIVRIHR